MKSKTNRNSSIELLRIITMLGVIFLHYNCEGMGGALDYVTKGSVNYYYLVFTENLFIGAVNLFIIISAFFLCTTESRKLEKGLELIIELIAFRLAVYLGGVFTGKIFSWSGFFASFLPVSYYVILYCILYFVSPYVNLVIKQLSTIQLKRMSLIMMMFFSVWSFLVDLLCLAGDFNPMSSIGMYGSNAGYTIVNFVLLYILGATVRRIYDEKCIVRKKCINIMILCLVVLFIMSLFTDLTWNYNNPIIIVMVMAILGCFSQINMSSNVINELAKASFTCFLVHGIFMSKIGIPTVVNKSIMILIIHQAGTAILLFIMSYIIYKIYSAVARPIIELIKRKTENIDIYHI